jgi:SAM-dependent methyltransferase
MAKESTGPETVRLDLREGREGRPPRGRDRVLGVYTGDLADVGRYLKRLAGAEQAFDEAFFEEKYAWVDPFGYGGTPYDELRRGLVRYGLGLRKWGHICEVGAGEGFLAAGFRDLCERATLNDLSATALTRARRLVDRPGEDLAGDAITSLQRVPDASVDAMVIAEILYYVAPVPFARYGRALRAEVARTLRPGGRLVLLHPYGPVLHAAYRHGADFKVVTKVELRTTRALEMLALERRA